MNKTGGVFTKEIPYTPRIPIVSSFLKTAKTQNETIINGVELSSRALERFSKDMYFNTLIELAKKEPTAYEKSRTYEMVVSIDGTAYTGRSGYFPYHPAKTITWKKSACGLPKAVGALDYAGATLSTVVKGGIAYEGSKFKYLPPCKNCQNVFAEQIIPHFNVYSIPTRTFFEYIPILYPVSMDYETDNLSDEAL